MKIISKILTNYCGSHRFLTPETEFNIDRENIFKSVLVLDMEQIK